MYAVIGADGYMGAYALKNILAQTDDTIIATARNVDTKENSARVTWEKLDVTDYKFNDGTLTRLTDTINRLRESRINSNLKIIYLAASHNPDFVEKYPREAWDVNVTALAYFLNRVGNVKAFFYASTDSVYGESVNGYHFKETDGLNPVNIYGRQKVVAEELVRGYGYNVVRFPFLISPSLSPKKKHFYDTIVETLKAGDNIEMFADSYRSTISFDTATSILVCLMEKNVVLPEILNVCGDDDLSKYDVGLKIADKIKVSRNLVIPVSVIKTIGVFETKRASSTLMDNSLVKKILGMDKIKLTV